MTKTPAAWLQQIIAVRDHDYAATIPIRNLDQHVDALANACAEAVTKWPGAGSIPKAVRAVPLRRRDTP